VAETETGVGVRDSQRPEGPILRFSKREWAQFVSDVKDGSFDLPT